MKRKYCPHCYGDLTEAPNYVEWQYQCCECGRAWAIIDDVYWLALFDASGHIYKVRGKTVTWIEERDPIWSKLWLKYKECKSVKK